MFCLKNFLPEFLLVLNWRIIKTIILLYQTEKEQKISDPSQLVETEITQKIFQQGATKKITKFRKRIEEVLESDDKSEIEKLKKQLTEFIESNNVYYQAKKQEAQQLLKQLESGSY